MYADEKNATNGPTLFARIGVMRALNRHVDHVSWGDGFAVINMPRSP
jgi:hypothetical protein